MVITPNNGLSIEFEISLVRVRKKINVSVILNYKTNDPVFPFVFFALAMHADLLQSKR